MNEKIIVIGLIGMFLLTGFTAVSAVANSPPDKPSIPSPEVVTKIGHVVTLFTMSHDCDGDKIKYGFDWDGDEVVEDRDWTDFYESYETVTCPHIYMKTGIYKVKVIAEDTHGAQSEWSEPGKVTVRLIKNKTINLALLRFLDLFPNAFLLLQRFLKL